LTDSITTGVYYDLAV